MSVSPEVEALRGALRSGIDALAIELHEAQVTRLLAYLTLLQKWNAVINLTAVRKPSDMLVQHLLDSLAVVPPFARALQRAEPSILDVGSGGGLPGVVLAVVRPEWTVQCVDAVGKKASFVQQVAAELRLPNLRATHARVETLERRDGHDLITSRAFASLKDFYALTGRLGNGSTQWAAMKAKLLPSETGELAALPVVFHVEPLTVPQLDAERCIVWLQPRKD